MRRAPGTRAAAAALALLGWGAVACTTPLELGERRYREGDRLTALEIWREADSDSFYYEAIQQRISEVEAEFEQLVVRYKKRALYYEEKGRLAESVLNYRLALKLQPDDRTTLAHVQDLVRALATRRAQLRWAYRESFGRGDLAEARIHLDALRSLDPLSPEVATDERQLEAALRAEVERLLARGRRGFSSGHHDRARLAFEAALALDPDDENAQGYLSYIAKIRSEEDETAPDSSSLQDARALLATEDEIRAEGSYQKALAAERDGRFFDAIRRDQEALRRNPQHPRARRHLQALRRQLAPRIEGLVEDGRERFKDQDLEAALERWRRVLLIDPDHAQTKEYVARAERLLDNLERLRAEAAGAS